MEETSNIPSRITDPTTGEEYYVFSAKLARVEKNSDTNIFYPNFTLKYIYEFIGNECEIDGPKINSYFYLFIDIFLRRREKESIFLKNALYKSINDEAITFLACVNVRDTTMQYLLPSKDFNPEKYIEKQERVGKFLYIISILAVIAFVLQIITRGSYIPFLSFVLIMLITFWISWNKYAGYN